MAKRRMISDAICMSDAFLELPFSARCLYFTLNLCADDEGVIGAPKRAIRESGTAQSDLDALIDAGFVMNLRNGVVLIKHWHVHNSIRKDRRTLSTYQDELLDVKLKPDGAYTYVKTANVENFGENRNADFAVIIHDSKKRDFGTDVSAGQTAV